MTADEMLALAQRTITQVSAVDAQAQLQSPSPPLLLDVREPSEYESGHLADATHCPLNTLTADLCAGLLPDRDASMLVYCHSGQRSAFAVYWMKQWGYTHVANLTGGIVAWQRAGGAILR